MFRRLLTKIITVNRGRGDVFMRKEILLSIVFFLLVACVSSEKKRSLETQIDDVPHNSQKSASQDFVRVNVPKDFFDSLYHEWTLQWKENYSRDTALYQNITNCMYPDFPEDENAEIITIRPLVENVVTATIEGFSKDGKKHIIYDETPIDSLKKKTFDIFFFPSTFAFVFSDHFLLGVRSQWIDRESTPNYKAQLSRCAEKFGVKVLDEIETREVFNQQNQRLEELFRNRK